MHGVTRGHEPLRSSPHHRPLSTLISLTGSILFLRYLPYSSLPPSLPRSLGTSILPLPLFSSSLEIMRDPVTCAGDGMTYERKSIETWLNAGNTTSPITGLPLSSIVLAPSQLARSVIMAWREGEGKALLAQQSAGDE